MQGQNGREPRERFDVDAAQARLDSLGSTIARLKAEHAPPATQPVIGATIVVDTTILVQFSKVAYLGGHPLFPGAVDPLNVSFSPSGMTLGTATQKFGERPWSVIRSIVAEDREGVRSRVTVTRLLALGVWALAVPKTKRFAYLVVSDDEGDWIFEVRDTTAMDLRARIQPLQRATIRQLPEVAAAHGPGSGNDRDLEARLDRLKGLADRGVISESEYVAQRAAIIAGI